MVAVLNTIASTKMNAVSDNKYILSADLVVDIMLRDLHVREEVD